MPSASEVSRMTDVEVGFQPRVLVDCRICHDEDEVLNMEIPCSCSGSLKYAHRRCVERWCNEKGDTICEICHQQFKPGYTASPTFHHGGIPTNFRGELQVSRRDLNNFLFTAPVADPYFLDHDFDDYTNHTSRSLICCRVVATIFTVLLLLRYILPIIIYGAGEYSIQIFMLLVLRTVGILLPIYIMVKVFTIIQRRQHQQDAHRFSLATASDEENELRESQPQPHLIDVQ